jgi:ABC-2 type transport system permease protein
VTVRRTPNFFQHLWLLWGLRLRIGLNRGTPGRWWVAVPAFLFSSFPSVVLASSFFTLMLVPAVRDSYYWPDFVLRLLSFVTTCVWVTWPVLSAGVDDHSELSRYAAFPISSFRLMVASTLASLFEPRALVFYGPLVGATLGYMVVTPPAQPVLVALCFAGYVFFNAALSRVGLHLVLDVLRQKRSAELIGGGFVVTLVVASFIPPVDTRWLTQLGDAGVAAVPDQLVENATLALGRFPTGYFAVAVGKSAGGKLVPVVALLIVIWAMMLAALWAAWKLLVRFHSQSGRGGGPINSTARTANPFVRTPTLFRTLVVREALDLWHNPRARLLVAVPFVLGILLKLLSGRALFMYLFGQTVDAWLLGGMSVYGAIVLGSTFSQNAFAYDGQGFSTFLSAPIELGDVLRAKNLVHALAGAGLATLVGLFYVTYFGHGGLLDIALAAASVATLIPAVLTVGNALSLYFPVKFHANLKRRDKLPFLASMIGVAGAGLGTWPLASVLRMRGTDAPELVDLGIVACNSALAWLVYRATLPWAIAKLGERREIVLRAVTRE